MLNKVLCIDDDPITLMICSIIMQKTNFCKQMDEAANGADGLQYFEDILSTPGAIAPELILLDINMPVLNGWDFLNQYTEKYKANFPDCKIIILTSSINPGDRQLAEQNAHVVDFLVKPVTMTGMETLKNNEHLKAYFTQQ